MDRQTIRTKVLVLSDTHGMSMDETMPAGVASADVAVHAGDLTDLSKIDEFHTTLGLLRRIDAALKLVIAGNHDFTLDTPAFKQIITESGLEGEGGLLKKTYGDFEEAKEPFTNARDEGFFFLDEGTYHFTLQNGAALTVYASPFTPSVGNWGFQYHPSQGHEFHVEEGTDIAITHGPPHGILDRTSRGRAGSPHLFSAIAKAKPLIHCFGHIHEGWGAKMVAWRDHARGEPSHLTHIDNDKSAVIEQLSTLEPRKFDTPEDIKNKKEKTSKYSSQRFCTASQLHRTETSRTTLFVNAAIKGDGDDEDSAHYPWIVEVDLPVDKTSEESLIPSIKTAKRKRFLDEDENEENRNG